MSRMRTLEVSEKERLEITRAGRGNVAWIHLRLSNRKIGFDDLDGSFRNKRMYQSTKDRFAPLSLPVLWRSEVAPRRRRNRLIMDGAVLGLLFLIFGGCSPDYQAGDCIQNSKDGYIWRIIAVESGKYTAQGWINGKWGLTVPIDPEVPRGRDVKVQCPFSTEVLQERR
jgi:hypothetical protein